MRALIQSYRRLYQQGSEFVTDAFLDSRLAEGKITQEEYDYVKA